MKYIFFSKTNISSNSVVSALDRERRHVSLILDTFFATKWNLSQMIFSCISLLGNSHVLQAAVATIV